MPSVTADISFEEIVKFEHGNFTFSQDGPRRKKTTANLVDIVHTLHSEHQYFEFLLRTLEEEAEKLQPGKIPDYHLLRDIVDYFARYPDQYHHPREDMLFNNMLERDPPSSASWTDSCGNTKPCITTTARCSSS